MGAYDLSAQLVYRNTTRLIKANQLSSPPAWFAAVGDIPPSGRSIARPALQRPGGKLDKRSGRRPSRGMFKPVKLTYEEDALRTNFFKDHPWELARPRKVLEDDGNDAKDQNWSVRIGEAAGGRAADGESVVQRQRYLMKHNDLDREQAYDVARRELYEQRHRDQVEARVAKEEALAVGAYFGMSALDVGAKLEDKIMAQYQEEAVKKMEEVDAARRQADQADEIDTGVEGQNREEQMPAGNSIPRR